MQHIDDLIAAVSAAMLASGKTAKEIMKIAKISSTTARSAMKGQIGSTKTLRALQSVFSPWGPRYGRPSVFVQDIMQDLMRRLNHDERPLHAISYLSGVSHPVIRRIKYGEKHVAVDSVRRLQNFYGYTREG